MTTISVCQSLSDFSEDRVMRQTLLIGIDICTTREMKKPQPQPLRADEVIRYVVLFSRALVRTLKAKKS